MSIFTNFVLTESKNGVEQMLLFKAKDETDCIKQWRMHYNKNPYKEDDALYDRVNSYRQMSGYRDMEYVHSYMVSIRRVSDNDFKILERFCKPMFDYCRKMYEK
jgi:hypothetical protein